MAKTRVSAKNINPIESLDKALKDLKEPLAELGRRWAKSPYRLRPEPPVSRKWERLLDAWVANPKLPLIIRNSGRRKEHTTCSNGREVIFSDNTPAIWSFELALNGQVPDIQSWSSGNIHGHIPLSFVTKGPLGKQNLYKLGWSVRHIKPVSDRKRIRVEDSPVERLEGMFRRLLSPANIFLIPKEISGAGELPQVIKSVAARDQHK